MKTMQYISLLLVCCSAIEAATPTIGINFTPVTASYNLSAVSTPQNPTVGVGATQAISMTYALVTSYNKTTGLADGIINNDSGAFAGVSVGINDNWIIYNRFAQRFIFSGEDENAVLLQFFVSHDATITPTTVWDYHVLSPDQINPLGGGANGFIDFNQPGYDQNAYYNSVATFDVNGIFLGSSLTVTPQSAILAGTANTTVFPGLFADNPLFIVQEGFAFPATNFDANPTYGYYVWLNYDTPAAPNSTDGDTIQLYRILDAGSNTPTLGPLVTAPFVPFSYGILSAPHLGNLFGVVGELQTGFGRISAYPHVRNHQLYMCQDLQLNSTGTPDANGDRVGILWSQFDLTGDVTGQGLGTEAADTIPVLIQSGTLFDNSATNPLFYFNSSIMTDKNSNMVLNFNISSAVQYVDTAFAYRAASDPAGTLRAPVLIQQSQHPYNFSPFTSLSPGPNVQRWGDQSVVVTDSNDDVTFWLTQYWVALQNAWGIQLTQLLPG